jgi:hypothetical protein
MRQIFPHNEESLLIDFLKEMPEMFSSRKKIKPDPREEKGQAEILELVRLAKSKPIRPSTPTTVPDHAVSVILGACYDIDEQRWEQIKLEHQYSMVAENLVGELLERYIDHISKKHNLGWIRAWGDIVKHVDFIKKTDDGWMLLQIKNRDNSENSSSQSVRNGTNIIKWFRTFSRSGKTNWEKFPDPDFTNFASEHGFLKFIETILRNGNNS